MQESVLFQPGKLMESTANEVGKSSAELELEKLLEVSAPLAFRVAMGVLRDTAEAEDVAQEALLKAYRRFPMLRDAERFRGWIVRISFRLAIDRLRSRKRRMERETRWAEPELRAQQPSTEEVAASNEFQKRLSTALDRLPEEQRLTMLLTAVEGHSNDEAAKMLAVPVGTVKSRVFKARKRLAEMLR